MSPRPTPARAGGRVRLRLVAASTAAMTAVLVLGAAFLVWRVQAGLRADIDASVRQQALSAAAAVADDPTASTFPVSPNLSGIGQVVDSSGAVVASSEEIDGEPRLYDFTAAAAGAAPSLRTIRLSQVDNAELRVAGVGVPGVPGLSVYVGLRTAEVGRSVTALVTSLALGMPMVLALLALLAWAYVGRALRPVDDLLAKLDRSLERQRRFVADAAHELRSPVAAIRAQVESPPPGDQAWSYGAAVKDEAARLSTLVDDLLALARLDAEPTLRSRPLDLDDIVFAESRTLREHPDLELDLSGVHAVRISGDQSLLTRAVRNLLDNAARHAATVVTVELRADDGVADLVVADDGPGIRSEDRERVFERFTRLDDARARDSGGVGLGLAIVADVVAAHRGTVALLDNGPGARVQIRLPRLQASSSGSTR